LILEPRKFISTSHRDLELTEQSFSGISYFIGRRAPGPDDIQVLAKWPANGSFNGEHQKVPSKINYALDGKISWGHDIPENATPLQWFKLLLLEEDDLPVHLKDRNSEHMKRARRELRELGKDAVTVIADYRKSTLLPKYLRQESLHVLVLNKNTAVRELWNYAMKKIRERENPIVVDTCQAHIVLTVPAIWKDQEREKMRLAMDMAGILEPRKFCGRTTLSLISEPEAAAIATLYAPRLQDRPDVEKGDTFLIVDCGGKLHYAANCPRY
jgi:hypothetical protein